MEELNKALETLLAEIKDLREQQEDTLELLKELVEEL